MRKYYILHNTSSLCALESLNNMSLGSIKYVILFVNARFLNLISSLLEGLIRPCEHVWRASLCKHFTSSLCVLTLFIFVMRIKRLMGGMFICSLLKSVTFDLSQTLPAPFSLSYLLVLQISSKSKQNCQSYILKIQIWMSIHNSYLDPNFDTKSEPVQYHPNSYNPWKFQHCISNGLWDMVFQRKGKNWRKR